jgi:hypothetical protein
MTEQNQEARGLARDLFGDLPLGGDPDAFVARLDERLDELILETTEKIIGYEPWDTPERQLVACALQGWGEIRSADTFARQIMKLGCEHPELKLLVSRQLHDEMRHYWLYRDCARKMADRDAMLEIPPDPRLIQLFDYFDSVSEDVLEQMFVCQFCSEKAALRLFTVSMNKFDVHPQFRAVLDQIIPDEKFHVSNGRVAARLLAKRGEEAQRRLIDLAAEQMLYTQTALQGNAGALP